MQNNKDFHRKFMQLFHEISSNFNLEKYSEVLEPKGKVLEENPFSTIWDTLDKIKDYDYINIGNGKFVKREYFFKKPIRILFSILLFEVETRLYRSLELNGEEIGQLDEKHMNELIRLFLEKDFINLQNEYNSRSKFKEDLKSLSSFRNLIAHVNKKLEYSIDYKTLIKRKYQVIKVLMALQQITDNLK